MIFRALAALLLTVATTTSANTKAASLPEVRLYTLDCGQLDFKDMALVSDTGDYAGRSGTMAVPCYLIRHGSTWVLWDAGLGDAIAGKPGGEDRFGFHWTVRKTLAAQLADLGLTPSDISIVALSHIHGDHVGNIGLFPAATVYVSPLELPWGLQSPPPPTVDASLVRLLSRMSIHPVPFDLDLFGDGSVVMLRTAGHSPGHHSLLLRLPKSGVFVLSGDLWHFREDYDRSLMTAVNDSRAETLASMQRIKALAEHEHARIIIQHDPNDFRQMPKPPAYLD